jgi:hypothetical protein
VIGSFIDPAVYHSFPILVLLCSLVYVALLLSLAYHLGVSSDLALCATIEIIETSLGRRLCITLAEQVPNLLRHLIY